MATQVREEKMSEFGFPLPAGDPSVLPAGAKLERVFDAACFLTEGISVSPDDGVVYFCDITFTPLCKDPWAGTRGPATSGNWTQRPDRRPFFARQAAWQPGRNSMPKAISSSPKAMISEVVVSARSI